MNVYEQTHRFDVRRHPLSARRGDGLRAVRDGQSVRHRDRRVRFAVAWQVSVTVSGIGADRTQFTDATGGFRFLGLDPGGYTVIAELDGFGGIEYPDVVIRLGQNTDVPLTLTAALEETITVTSESPLLDERQISAGTNVSQVELEKIPTARDPWAVLSQTPGVIVDRVNVGGNESGQQANFRAAGVSSNQNDFQMDGSEITDMRATGASPTYYDFDQFAEMSFTTGGTDVTKNSSGVQVNLVTKRGTNEFRGSARFYNTAATGYFGGALKASQPNIDGELHKSNGQTSLAGARVRKIEDFGFEAGGAAIQDRLWFWGSWGQNDIGPERRFRYGRRHASREHGDQGERPDQRRELDRRFLQQRRQAEVRARRRHHPAAGNDLEPAWSLGAVPPRRPARRLGEPVLHRHLHARRLRLRPLRQEQPGRRERSPPDAPDPQRDDGIWSNNYLSGFAASPERPAKGRRHVLLHQRRQRHARTSVRRPVPHLREQLDLPLGARTRPGIGSIGSGRTTPGTTLASCWPSTPGCGSRTRSRLGMMTINAGLRYDEQGGENKAYELPAHPTRPELIPGLSYPGGGAGFTWESIAPRLGFTYAPRAGARHPGSRELLPVRPTSCRRTRSIGCRRSVTRSPSAIR